MLQYDMALNKWEKFFKVFLILTGVIVFLIIFYAGMLLLAGKLGIEYMQEMSKFYKELNVTVAGAIVSIVTALLASNKNVNDMVSKFTSKFFNR